MEVVVSAITGELLSRFISFLINKHTNRACLEEKLERLRHLLLRVHSVVEEAEGRYITNAGMLAQLNMLVNGMYRGYYLLDTIKYRPPEEMRSQQQHQVSRSCSLSLPSPVKRFRTTRRMIDGNGIQSVLEDLETVVANMAEFAILLAGCERMCRRPYDSHIYIDNFMFGRTVEKQRITNFLLQDVSPLGAPAVLPIIGGCHVGKKTLVGHACHDTRVLSHFSSILHLNADDIWRKGHELLLFTQPGRILVVVEFFSDVDDHHWEQFYSSMMTSKCRGSKIVIISKLKATARFGTVKPICLNSLPHEEYVYLFKVLAFGGADPDDHPQLLSIGMEIATLFRGMFVAANVLANMLRKNLNAQYWLHILKSFRNVVEDNLSVFDEYPKLLLDKDHPMDITSFASQYGRRNPLRLVPSHGESSVGQRELSNVTFGELVAGSSSATLLPKDEFEIVVWESRLPPYTKFVATCAEQKPPCTSSSSKKRRGFEM